MFYAISCVVLVHDNCKIILNKISMAFDIEYPNNPIYMNRISILTILESNNRLYKNKILSNIIYFLFKLVLAQEERACCIEI